MGGLRGNSGWRVQNIWGGEYKWQYKWADTEEEDGVSSAEQDIEQRRLVLKGQKAPTCLMQFKFVCYKCPLV